MKQISTTLDEYVFTPDDTVVEGEVEAGKRYEESDFNRSIEIVEREKKRVAARAGTTTPFWWGSKITPPQANYDKQQKTVAVGNFAANLWGLYQVHGNVWEWCEDLWHRNYIDAPSDGSAWLQGGNESLRVFRGGSWDRYPDCLRSAYRFWCPSLALNDDLGFRVARTLNP